MGLPLPGSPVTAGGGSSVTQSALRGAGFKLPAQGGASALSPASSAGGRPMHGLGLPGMGLLSPPPKEMGATTTAHPAQTPPMPAEVAAFEAAQAVVESAALPQAAVESDGAAREGRPHDA
jgi:hypothetical protein